MSFTDMTDQQVLDIANPMLDNYIAASHEFLQGTTAFDYAKYTKHFSKRLKTGSATKRKTKKDM
jgi:hypothetical protein